MRAAALRMTLNYSTLNLRDCGERKNGDSSGPRVTVIAPNLYVLDQNKTHVHKTQSLGCRLAPEMVLVARIIVRLSYADC